MQDVTQNLDFVRKSTLDTIPNTEIAPSSVHGFGLFATQTIDRGKVIAHLDGQLISQRDYENLASTLSPYIAPYKNYFFMECTYLPNSMLLVRTLRTKYSYINHHRKPNVRIDFDSMDLITLRYIEDGEELLIDYRKEWLPENYRYGERGRYL